MSGPRPWWASDGATDGRIDPGEDPLDAHRAARAGPGGRGRPEPSSVGTHATGAEICGVCPVCVTARFLGETRPELLAHLTEAGRHLSAALRTVLDPPTGRGDDRDPGDGPVRDPVDADEGVRRIDLD